MADVHQLLDKHGKQGAISANLVRRDVIEAAALYLSDEDTALAFAYSGWAQCALPHKRRIHPPNTAFPARRAG